MVLSHLGVRDNSKNSSKPLTISAHLQVVKLLHPVCMLRGLHFVRNKNFKGLNYRQKQELALLTGKSGRCKIQPIYLETSHLLWALKLSDSQVHANHWNQTRGHPRLTSCWEWRGNPIGSSVCWIQQNLQSPFPPRCAYV